jgi:hypothetical protein
MSIPSVQLQVEKYPLGRPLVRAPGKLVAGKNEIDCTIAVSHMYHALVGAVGAQGAQGTQGQLGVVRIVLNHQHFDIASHGISPMGTGGPELFWAGQPAVSPAVIPPRN